MTERKKSLGFIHPEDVTVDIDRDGIVVCADGLDAQKQQLLEALELQRAGEMSPGQETSVDQINDIISKIEEIESLGELLDLMSVNGLGSVTTPDDVDESERRRIGFTTVVDPSSD